MRRAVDGARRPHQEPSMPYTYPTPPAQPAIPHPPDPVIVAEARRVLREAVGTLSTCDDRAAYCAALAAPIARLCDETKCRGLRAEQLIIAVKSAWASLPDTQWWRREADGALLAIIITVCIEQYFLESERARSALA
jgi:hypothetical protein